MKKKLDDPIIAAVRSLGPDATPSAVCIEISKPTGRTESLSRVMFAMQRLAREGVLKERWVVSDRNLRRRVYSLGGGKPTPRPQASHGGLVPAC